VNSLLYGMALYGRSFSEGCDESPQMHQICDGVLPAEMCMVYVMMCTGLPTVLKCRHIAAVALSILLQVLFLSLTAYRLELPFVPTGTSIIHMQVLQCLILYEYENFSRRMYLNQTLALQSHKNMLNAENDAVLKELRTTELRHLFGNVAHDLKTPLQAFSFEMDAILSHVRSGEDGASVADHIERSVEYMRNTSLFFRMTINRALDYSKASAGIVLQPSYETVGLRASLTRVQNCLRCFDDVREFNHFTVEVSPDVSEFVVTDPHWLEENLLSLASNAQKFSKTGRVIVRCFIVDNALLNTYSDKFMTIPSVTKLTESSISTRQHAGVKVQSDAEHMLAFEVIDDGVGIPKAQRISIFESTKQSSRHTGGTGMGLYALYHRVHALGGSCGVRDRVERVPGARFWFTIPYVRAKAPGRIITIDSNIASVVDDFTPAMSREAVQTMTHGKDDCSPKVLIVDDSVLIRKTTGRALKLVGVASDVAEDGAVCLDKIDQGNYELILMDIQMPVMGGIESTKRIRAMEHETGRARVTIIGVSANSDGETKSEALAAGMDGFLPKPMNMETLRCLLESIDCDLWESVKRKR
jgi:signal transduction histidine kinase/ActR/RegA family two-component response regulator